MKIFIIIITAICGLAEASPAVTVSSPSISTSKISSGTTLVTSTSSSSSLNTTSTSSSSTSTTSSVSITCTSTPLPSILGFTALLDPLTYTNIPMKRTAVPSTCSIIPTSTNSTSVISSTTTATSTHRCIDGPCAAPTPTSCSFYSCLDGVMGCGSNGYPAAYGLYYCNRFMTAMGNMDDAGKKWITSTMLCLQNSLLKFGQGTSITCDALKDYAFGTHANCYVQNGICDLSAADWAVIVDTVGFSNLWSSLNAAGQTLSAMRQCANFFFWAAGRNLWPASCPLPNPF
ncbi:hypothetical protein SBOR_1165 [Sclerotinia borealis F-4128]|uniref:Uncharacterized protein n=1 Tax=Sclerotinia borealis (strain F-4128) TaxID=1432307 RepID=W9CQZ9_SCLBF|nr:hypothetical protein SBOR_1165 [Sclerotinia borealis F-4128]